MRFPSAHHLVPNGLRVAFKHVAVHRARETRHILARHVGQLAIIQIHRELNDKQGEVDAFIRRRANAHQPRKIHGGSSSAAGRELLQHRIVVPLLVKQLIVPRVIVEHHGFPVRPHFRISVKHVFQNDAQVFLEYVHVRLL